MSMHLRPGLVPVVLAGSQLVAGCNALSGVGELKFVETEGEGGGGVYAMVTGVTTGPGSPSARGNGGSGGGAPVPACGEQYGSSPGYVTCDESMWHCEFVATLAQVVSCSAVCQAFGGECLGVAGNATEGACDPSSPAACGDTDLADAICECSHGCGAGPPCANPEVCTAGECVAP